jgi:hypothetical protein
MDVDHPGRQVIQVLLVERFVYEFDLKIHGSILLTLSLRVPHTAGQHAPQQGTPAIVMLNGSAAQGALRQVASEASRFESF